MKEILQQMYSEVDAKLKCTFWYVAEKANSSEANGTEYSNI